MLKVVLATIVICAVSSDIVVYRDCGSKSGTVKSVDVTPCPSEPCQFHREANASFAINFVANVNITSARNVVYGIILGVKVPFPVPTDGCQDMVCPIASGSSVVYKNAIYVQKEYPAVSLVAQWEVHDQNDILIMCIDVPAQIVN